MVQSLRNKKAAFEMSMTTIIVIVLSVVFLIMGLVLLRNISQVATGSISGIDEKLKTQMSSLFADEEQPIFIKPEDGQLKIRAGTTNFGFIIGGRTKNGVDIVKRSDVQYRLILNPDSDCAKKIGVAKIKSWFAGSSKIAASDDDSVYNPITDYKSDMGFVRVQVDVPSGTVLCTQNVLYDFIDKTDPTQTQPIGGGSFTIQVIRKALI